MKTVVLVIGQSNVNLLETELKEFVDHPSVQVEIITDKEFEFLIWDIENGSDNSIF